VSGRIRGLRPQQNHSGLPSALPRAIYGHPASGSGFRTHPSKICPHRESNPDLRFRKPSFYPLNYGDGNAAVARLVSLEANDIC
jgi:hypothetical protein